MDKEKKKTANYYLLIYAAIKIELECSKYKLCTWVLGSVLFSNKLLNKISDKWKKRASFTKFLFVNSFHNENHFPLRYKTYAPSLSLWWQPFNFLRHQLGQNWLNSENKSCQLQLWRILLSFFFLQVTLLLSTSCVYSNNNQSFCCNLPLQFNRFLTLRKTKICAINHIRNPPINIQGPLTSYSALLNQSFTCIKISQWIIHKLSTSPRQSFKRSIRAPWENSGNTKDGLFCYSGIISNQISHDDDVSTSIIQTWILYFMEKKEFEGGKRKRATVVKFGRKAPGRKTTRFCWHG